MLILFDTCSGMLRYMLLSFRTCVEQDPKQIKRKQGKPAVFTSLFANKKWEFPEKLPLGGAAGNRTLVQTYSP
jgi:hypothetical protein